ncbi:MAG: molybdopterin-dependent oxidoreductase [Planctomycetes bacterium]|nr:molybdopterin-dependent oxidoreductase [Planctomycetota bacterium]
MSDEIERSVDPPNAGTWNVVGKPRRRVDGRAKVTGQTKFADDLVLPNMLFCRLLRSPFPFARIKSIETTKAEGMPGVKLVLTGKDTPVTYGILPVSQDEHPLAQELVRHVGDPVAAVIATCEEEAQAACEAIEVDYEVLTTISTAEQAITTPEPQLHAYAQEGNVHKRVALQFGDVDEALENSAHVFEDVFFYEGNTHLPIEQHASLAEVDKDGNLTIWSSTQTPHYLHRAIARALEFEPHRIRVIATPNGGGFGGKSDPFNHELVVCKAALVLGRPIKITLNREEVFYCHRGRHPVQMKFRTGVDADGKITAMDLETLLDGGAYGSYGVASTFYTGALQTVTYKIPRYRFRGCRAFTNKPACGPKRGHGTVQPRFGQEIQLDKIAVALNKSPVDLRLNMLVEPDSLTANFLTVGTIALKECIEKVVTGSGFRERWGNLPEGRGLGLACSSYICGAGLPIYWNKLPHSGVQLRLDRMGSVTAFCGATEIGQGSDDVLALLVAEVLGLDPQDIHLRTGATDITPVDLGSYSSRVTLMMGHAAIEAAQRARALIAEAVALKLEVPKGRLVFAGRRVFDSQDPEVGMTFREAVVEGETLHGTLGTTGSYRPPRSPARFRGGGVGPSPAYSYSATVVEVEVDPDTGWIAVDKIWIAHDIGRSLNPTLVRGQVEGSVYMGLGEALMEESIFRRLPGKLSPALVHKFPSMLEYKSPTSLDMPEIVTYLIEEPDPKGPFGAKEVGQGPLLPIMPGVANAVYDAVGVRVDENPITPEKILKALEAKRKGKEPRYGPKSFPEIPWEDPFCVSPPWEGGDGTADNAPQRKRAATKEVYR